MPKREETLTEAVDRISFEKVGQYPTVAELQAILARLSEESTVSNGRIEIIARDVIVPRR